MATVIMAGSIAHQFYVVIPHTPAEHDAPINARRPALSAAKILAPRRSWQYRSACLAGKSVADAAASGRSATVKCPHKPPAPKNSFCKSHQHDQGRVALPRKFFSFVF